MYAARQTKKQCPLVELLMCGIVGLFLKDKSLEADLGRMLSEMLVTMTDRGPDSAGIAVYNEHQAGLVKITVQADHPQTDFDGLEKKLGTAIGASVKMDVRDTHAVLAMPQASLNAAMAELRQLDPVIRIMGHGESIEIYKEVGLRGTEAVPPPDSLCTFFGKPRVNRLGDPLWGQAHRLPWRMLGGRAPALTDDPIHQCVDDSLWPRQILERALAHRQRFDPCFDFGFNRSWRDEGPAHGAGQENQAWAPRIIWRALVPDWASINAWRIEESRQVRPISASVAKWDSGSPVGEISRKTSRTLWGP